MLRKNLKNLFFVLLVPFLMLSCAKSFSTRNPLKDAVDEASKTNPELNYVMEHHDLYHVYGQVYVDTITGGTTNLYDYLIAEKLLDAAAVWGNPANLAANLRSIYVVLVVKKNSTEADLHIGGNDAFVQFKGSITEQIGTASTVNFTGRDTAGSATLSGTINGNIIGNLNIIIDGSNPFALPNFTLENVFP